MTRAMPSHIRHILSSAAVASTKSSSAVRRILHHRNPFRAEQRASSGTAMAVGAADKPSTTQPAPSGSDPPSERSFSWNAVDALVATSSDKHLRLVEKLQETEYLSSPNCVLAMQIVDRKDFVLPEIPQNVVYKVRHQRYISLFFWRVELWCSQARWQPE